MRKVGMEEGEEWKSWKGMKRRIGVRGILVRGEEEEGRKCKGKGRIE